ncbi:hypothetical protein E2C01_002495 [Portunus trituberculatus]|uniref:Uncharacterized protein n=1 Tax=Portunus trituberculatus TaxID=210409 RepID=A0A5B7CJU1_PORTR|nr:hypothetical protein [Portunus trituberculatus]
MKLLPRLVLGVEGVEGGQVLGGEGERGYLLLLPPTTTPAVPMLRLSPLAELTGRERETLVASFGIPHESRQDILGARTRGKSDTCLMQRSCFLLRSRPAERKRESWWMKGVFQGRRYDLEGRGNLCLGSYLKRV